MNARTSGPKRAGVKVAIVGGAYLLLIFLIVTIEVVSGDAPFLRWAYLLGSLAYLAAVVVVCFMDIDRKHIVLSFAVLGILLGLFAGVVAGVNFKFLIGGSL